jgi:hypothetical protein
VGASLLAKAPVHPLNILWLKYRFREQAHSHTDFIQHRSSAVPEE